MTKGLFRRQEQDGPKTVESGRAYDSLAPRFDDLVIENPILAYSARVSLDLVRTAMAEAQTILDIGCGTGRETLELASSGKVLVACDPSVELLRILNNKAKQRGLTGRISTFPYAASQVDHLIDECGSHSFDGAYASFSLSYEPSLDLVPEKVWTLLRSGAPFLCSLYNRVCLSELLLLAPFLVPRRALRRLEGVTRLPVDEFEVVLKSTRPSQVRTIFGQRFQYMKSWGIPAIIPPNYLASIVRLAGSLRIPWENLDGRVNSRWPFRSLGSHVAYLFRARPES